MIPNTNYLRAIDRGEIIIRIEHTPAKGYVWHCVGGMLKLRLHEEAGYVCPMLTAKWAGYSSALYSGIAARLTEKGRAALNNHLTSAKA